MTKHPQTRFERRQLAQKKKEEREGRVRRKLAKNSLQAKESDDALKDHYVERGHSPFGTGSPSEGYERDTGQLHSDEIQVRA